MDELADCRGACELREEPAPARIHAEALSPREALDALYQLKKLTGR